jgi:hypothetical protein
VDAIPSILFMQVSQSLCYLLLIASDLDKSMMARHKKALHFVFSVKSDLTTAVQPTR